MSGLQLADRSPEEAIRRAGRAIAAGSVVEPAEAHVVRVLGDETAGDFGEPGYFSTFGTVPDLR